MLKSMFVSLKLQEKLSPYNARAPRGETSWSWQSSKDHVPPLAIISDSDTQGTMDLA